MAKKSANARAEEVSQKLVRLITRFYSAWRKSKVAKTDEALEAIKARLKDDKDIQILSYEPHELTFGIEWNATHYWTLRVRNTRKGVEADLDSARRPKACEPPPTPRKVIRNQWLSLAPAERFTHWTLSELRTLNESISRVGILTSLRKQALYHRVTVDDRKLELLSIRWNREYRSNLDACKTHEDHVALAAAFSDAVQPTNGRFLQEPELKD